MWIRRFGKSLLTNTFESYFEDRRELFCGLQNNEVRDGINKVSCSQIRHEFGQAHRKDFTT